MKNKSSFTSQIYTEIGFGNPSFISTEIEWPDGFEKRISGRISGWKVHSAYIRIWVGKIMLVLDLPQGLKIRKKEYNSFKFLLGLSGTSLISRER